jgi:hypothetical protein
MNNIIKYLSIISLFTILIFGNTNFTYATSDILEVTRGDVANPSFLHWNIIGGSGTCRPSFDAPFYPVDSGDGLYYLWTNGEAGTSQWKSFGQIPITKVYASPGNYVFRCKDLLSGREDTATLRVKPCASGTAWSEAAHSTATSQRNAIAAG